MIPVDYRFDEARCSFQVCTREGDGVRYDYFRLHVPDGSGELRTTMPPGIGDHIELSGYLREVRYSGAYRVVARTWRYPSFGSEAWPHVGPIRQGPILVVIIEEIVGRAHDDDRGGS